MDMGKVIKRKGKDMIYGSENHQQMLYALSFIILTNDNFNCHVKEGAINSELS